MAESCLHNMPSEKKAGLPPKIAATGLCFKLSLRETEVCGEKKLSSIYFISVCLNLAMTVSAEEFWICPGEKQKAELRCQ